MKLPRFDLGALLIGFTAAPIWIFLLVIITFSEHPFGMLAAPVALVGIMFAIHFLLRDWRYGWPVAFLLSPVLILAALLTIAALVDR